jgi:hypothetical protein
VRQRDDGLAAFFAGLREQRRLEETGLSYDEALAERQRIGDERVMAAVAKRRAEVRGFMREAHGIEMRAPRIDVALRARIGAAIPRQGTSRERRPASRRTRSASTSRDGPSSEPPLGRPLTAAERRYLKTKIDARRREVLAARPEVTLFDEEAAA